MEISIVIDENTAHGKQVLKVLEDMGVQTQPKKIASKDAALGIGRKATTQELDTYIEQCMLGN